MNGAIAVSVAIAEGPPATRSLLQFAAALPPPASVAMAATVTIMARGSNTRLGSAAVRAPSSDCRVTSDLLEKLVAHAAPDRPRVAVPASATRPVDQHAHAVGEERVVVECA